MRDRHLGRSQNMGRRPAEDHLAQAALGVGAFDQQVAAELGRLLEDRLAVVASWGGRQHGLDVELKPAQGRGELVAARAGHRPAFDRQHDDPLGLAQEGLGEGDRAGRLGRSVPGDHDRIAQRARRGRRRDEEGPPGLEQHGLERRHRGHRLARDRASENDEVEDAAMARQEGVPGRRVRIPADPRSRGAGLGARRGVHAQEAVSNMSRACPIASWSACSSTCQASPLTMSMGT